LGKGQVYTPPGTPMRGSQGGMGMISFAVVTGVKCVRVRRRRIFEMRGLIILDFSDFVVLVSYRMNVVSEMEKRVGGERNIKQVYGRWDGGERWLGRFKVR
jgi:hypothetical protein